MTINSKFRHAGFCSSLALALIGCSGENDDGSDPDDSSAEGIQIRYTEYGIPHVRASGYRDLGFGQGYAHARDNLCKIELGMLGFKGEFSRHFGADAPRNPATSTSRASSLATWSKTWSRSRRHSDLVRKCATW
jgi:acyl-homoserine-lactone acylase